MMLESVVVVVVAVYFWLLGGSIMLSSAWNGLNSVQSTNSYQVQSSVLRLEEIQNPSWIRSILLTSFWWFQAIGSGVISFVNGLQKPSCTNPPCFYWKKMKEPWDNHPVERDEDQ